MKRITTDQILEDAELAALFLRTLIDKGVPTQAAVNLTGQYLSSVSFARVSGEKPDDPWKQGES